MERSRRGNSSTPLRSAQDAKCKIIAMPSDLKTSEDWKPHLDMLAKLRSEGRLEGKLVAALNPGTVEDATDQGRKVATMAREVKKKQ